MRTRKSLALALILVSFCGCSLLFQRGHPKDEELFENFQTHRAEFDQLLQMFLADKNLGRVAPDFTRPDDPQTAGASKERINEYRRLFNSLNLSAGIEGGGAKETVWFYASTIGLSVSGSIKGYAYVKERPELIVDNLDTYHSKDGKSFTAFRHLEGNWYLYLDYED